mgnify:CR=1 FL=1
MHSNRNTTSIISYCNTTIFILKTIGKSTKTGTIVTFMPNFDIFKGCHFSYTTICERMQESAFLLSGLTIEVIDEEFHHRLF